MKEKMVLVSGCYDLLHAGHVAFFKTASRYGKLYVSIGKDENLLKLKGKKPYFSQEERVYMVGAVKYVTEAFVASGDGMLDFEEDMKRLKPDYFVVNHDGFTEGKKRLCAENNVELIVLDRIPEEGLPARSSSQSKKDLKFPYRLCLAGDGWISHGSQRFIPDHALLRRFGRNMISTTAREWRPVPEKLPQNCGEARFPMVTSNAMPNFFSEPRILPDLNTSPVPRISLEYCCLARTAWIITGLSGLAA